MYELKFENTETRPGCWSTVDVDVLKDGETVFQFNRSYPTHHSTNTKIFSLDGVDYLVYSSDYQTLNFYNLTKGENVQLTEESRKSLYGFCPVEVHVPQYKCTKSLWDCNGVEKSLLVYYTEKSLEDEAEQKETRDWPLLFHDFAFVTGCVWGDDSRWWLNVLDLQGIAKGEVFYVKDFKGTKGWTYLPYPLNLELKNSFIIEEYLEDEFDRNRLQIELTVPLTFGSKEVDVYKENKWR